MEGAKRSQKERGNVGVKGDHIGKKRKKISKKMVYHNHSLKKTRHYPVDTIRPPRLLRELPGKVLMGEEIQKEEVLVRRGRDHYVEKMTVVFHPRQEETK